MTHTPKTGAALALAVVLLAAVTACQGAETAGGGSSAPAPAAAAKVVEAYLQARVEANIDKMIALSCADWEGEARKEAASLRGVKAKLDGLTCQADGASGEAALVACQGNIIATYSGEDRALSVAKRKFKTVADGGEWRMCGYE